jgi:glycosyltransferase involved in cell wall biosynthesis
LQPNRGTYNRQQIKELSNFCSVKIIAPVPWSLPIGIVKKWHEFALVPRFEIIDGFEVFHTRFFMVPKIGRSLYGLFFYMSLLSEVKKIYRSFNFDIIYVPWAYPDGVGAYFIAKALKVPVVIGVLGTDVNEYVKYHIRRKFIIHSLANCSSVISVSDALRNIIVKHQVPKNKVTVITNGINRELFRSMNKNECRGLLGLPLGEKVVLFVGNLVPVKGIEHLVNAFAGIISQLPKTRLIIVGSGPLAVRLQELVVKLKLSGQIQLVSSQSHDRIPLWMNAADVFCLPSINEGCPNVVLEALSCGIPVVASNVGGIPELILSDNYGRLVKPADPRELEIAIMDVLQRDWDKDCICGHPLLFTWRENARKVFEVFQSAKDIDKRNYYEQKSEQRN